MIVHLPSDLENNWHFLQFSWVEESSTCLLLPASCLLASQQGKYSGLFYEGNLPLELVNNSSDFIKYKSYQTNLNLINQGKAIDAVFRYMSNDFGATANDIFLGNLRKHVLVSV